jgi:NADP-reducing hydrogenase subunit HndB
MARLKNPNELSHLREKLKTSLDEIQGTKIIITVGMGTCGLAAGAGAIFQAIQSEVAQRELDIIIRSVGCIGMCVREPLLDVQLPGQQRVTYNNVKPNQVPRIIEEHVVHGKIINEWAIGTVPSEW